LTISWIGRQQRVERAYEVVNALVAGAAARLGVRAVPGAGEP
jgi:hypothetical protein